MKTYTIIKYLNKHFRIKNYENKLITPFDIGAEFHAPVGLLLF
jgi:hypothetical protein